MSRSLGNVIADSLDLGLSYAERLLVGVSADQFARFARPGGQAIESNHAAFVFGHLSLYGPRIVAQLESGDGTASLPSEWPDMFSMDASCQDDPTGSIYPPMPRITEQFFSGYRAAGASLRAAGDDRLQQANPVGGRLSELFPTMGSMHTFYCGGHLMMHLGQLSA